jgi:hypothetical protein
VKFLTALSAYCNIVLSHKCIIPQIEISEKYCEIAARRLSQDVMTLDIPEPAPKQSLPDIDRFSSWINSDGTPFKVGG